MITVVIPAYNAEATLPACLSALRLQSQPADEILVVDDGSSDDTALVARRLGAAVSQQQHQGPAEARNLGIQLARGEIVLFTDADCEPCLDWVEQMVQPLADPTVSGVKGVYRTRQKQVVARLVQCEFAERYGLLDRSPTIDFVDTHAAAFRTSALREVGGFNPTFIGNEDVDLSYRLAQAGYRLVFNRRAVVYHQHPATWGRYMRLKVTRGYWRMMAYRRHPGKALRDSYTPQILKAQVLLVFLGVAAAAGMAIWPAIGWVAACCLVGLLACAIPFSRRVSRSEPDLTGWAYLFVVLRAVALSLGSAAGVLAILAAPMTANTARVKGKR
jgi:cellulose synthase/poly-beta-1,6-N-acetylglucosamine synthase-like glycosyltransferase